MKYTIVSGVELYVLFNRILVLCKTELRMLSFESFSLTLHFYL
jgi:hypothetical protein